jgi:hypothetical protein
MRNYLGAILFLLVVVATPPMSAQESTGVNGAQAKVRDLSDKTSPLDEPVVTLAVVPTYSPTALHTHTSGEAVVEVKINAEGSVVSAEGVSGSPLLTGGSKFAALRWKFASGSKGIRVVRLTFVYHLAPRDTPVEDLVAVFKPPYHVEITHVLPDETPMP